MTDVQIMPTDIMIFVGSFLISWFIAFAVSFFATRHMLRKGIQWLGIEKPDDMTVLAFSSLGVWLGVMAGFLLSVFFIESSLTLLTFSVIIFWTFCVMIAPAVGFKHAVFRHSIVEANNDEN